MMGTPLLFSNRAEFTISAVIFATQPQFKTAQDEINADPRKLPSWVPILGLYGPALFAQCDNQLALTKNLVSEWLERYMFAGDTEAKQKAEKIATHLADHNHFRSHARMVGMVELQTLVLRSLSSDRKEMSQ